MVFSLELLEDLRLILEASRALKDDTVVPVFSIALSLIFY